MFTEKCNYHKVFKVLTHYVGIQMLILMFADNFRWPMHCSARFWRDPFLQQEVRRSVHENHQSCIRRRQGKDHSVRELEIFPNKYSPFSYSREIGFLTGYESEIMEKAHLESVMIMGETLASDKPYDFAKTDMTTRIQQLVPVMLEHR